jgi:hypothetical protein
MPCSLEKHHVAVCRVISTNPATIAGAMDQCGCCWPWGLVVLDLVYLGGFRWSFLIPGKKSRKQIDAGIRPRNVIVAYLWRKAEPKRRY